MGKNDISVVHLQIVRDGRIPYGEMRLDTPEKAAKVMRDFLEDVDREHVLICYMDSSMKPKYIQIAGIGTINACLISVPEIFKSPKQKGHKGA